MNKNHKYIITKERKGQIIFIVLILLAVAIGLLWNTLEQTEVQTKPDVSYPMTNVNISWEQTHHPGPWGGVNDGH